MSHQNPLLLVLKTLCNFSVETCELKTIMLAGIPQDGYVFEIPVNLGWGYGSEVMNKYSCGGTELGFQHS